MKQLSTPNKEPVTWVFKAKGFTAEVKAQSWHVARAKAALQIGCEPQDLQLLETK